MCTISTLVTLMHTENWGELYEQLHVHNVLSRHHLYTASKNFFPHFFFTQSRIGKFLIISHNPYNTYFVYAI